MTPFVHLHVHSQYSLLDGACRLADLVAAAAEQEVKAVALTDHGVMSGVIDFYKRCQEAGVKPIVGCEMYVARESRLERRGENRGNPNDHLVLLARNAEGYLNLARLTSLAHLEGFYAKPRIDKPLLAQHSRGLIGLAACLQGEVASRLAAGDEAGAVQAAGQYADLFGKDGFYLEFMDHGIPEQRAVNRSLGAVARKTGLPVVATNDVHYLKRQHAEAHEALLCLQTQTVMSDPKRMRYPTPEFYLKSGDEMARLSAAFPEAVSNTLRVADQCDLALPFGEIHFPRYETPDGLSPKAYIARVGAEGLKRLYGIDNPDQPRTDAEREVMRRFRYELDMIEKTGFLDYYLVVWDYVQFAKRNGIPVGPGRGSGCGSLVAYTMGITAVEPLRYKLIFERFLNPERQSAPDFDIDFCQSRRGEVIDYVKRKYGRDQCAQIITFGSLGAKTCIRDIGRVLEIPLPKCDRLAKMVPDDPKITIQKALELNPEFKAASRDDPECARILSYAEVLEGLFRNAGVHAAGVVIGEKPLIEILPLGRDKEGEPVTQYPMEPVGEIGLLKMDFLGLQTLTVIQEAVSLIGTVRGVAVPIDALPLDDPAVFALLKEGRTVGVFQLESGGMQNTIRDVGVDTFEELIAVVALFRPGPMKMLPLYSARKKGRDKVVYDHPLLESILKDTYGIMVYQEQVQQVANLLAGYTLGAADNLRRAMGKKKKDVMAKERDAFVAGCRATHGIPPDQAGRIFDQMEEFAGYGFNKAHAAGYGVVTYQTAWLKAHYPTEFMCALISCEFGNFDKMGVFIAEAQEMGLSLLPPDVNASGVRFQPDGEKGLRFGLAGIKNVGEAAVRALVEERAKNGPYASLTDFVLRLDTQTVNRKVIESLIRCGAFDSLCPNRARLFNGLDMALARAASIAQDRRTGQGNLFEAFADPAAAGSPVADELPDCPAWDSGLLLSAEKELMGVYLTGHPLRDLELTLKPYQTATARELLETGADNQRAQIAGMALRVEPRLSKEKKPYAILALETFDGAIEVMVWPSTYEKAKACLAADRPYLVCGLLRRRDEGKSSFSADAIVPIEDLPRQFARAVTLRLSGLTLDEARLTAIREALGRHPGPAELFLEMEFPGEASVRVACDPAFRVLPDSAMIADLLPWTGKNGIRIETRVFEPPKKENGRYYSNESRFREKRR